MLKMKGGSQVYSEKEIEGWREQEEQNVKVIKYMIDEYIDKDIGLKKIKERKIIKENKNKQIFRIKSNSMEEMIQKIEIGFKE